MLFSLNASHRARRTSPWTLVTPFSVSRIQNLSEKLMELSPNSVIQQTGLGCSTTRSGFEAAAEAMAMTSWGLLS